MNLQLATVATDISQLGDALEGNVVAWGIAVIGVALVGLAVRSVLAMLRS